MARLADLTFDARHPASLARFWAAALDGYAVAPYDEAELERLRAKGIDDPEDDPSVLVEGRVPPRLWFQRVPAEKSTKNRLHLDVRADDVEAEIERLTGLGARVLDRHEEDGMRWVVCADPEGNEFCVFAPEGGGG